MLFVYSKNQKGYTSKIYCNPVGKQSTKILGNWMKHQKQDGRIYILEIIKTIYKIRWGREIWKLNIPSFSEVFSYMRIPKKYGIPIEVWESIIVIFSNWRIDRLQWWRNISRWPVTKIDTFIQDRHENFFTYRLSFHLFPLLHTFFLYGFQILLDFVTLYLNLRCLDFLLVGDDNHRKA